MNTVKKTNQETYVPFNSQFLPKGNPVLLEFMERSSRIEGELKTIPLSVAITATLANKIVKDLAYPKNMSAKLNENKKMKGSDIVRDIMFSNFGANVLTASDIEEILGVTFETLVIHGAFDQLSTCDSMENFVLPVSFWKGDESNKGVYSRVRKTLNFDRRQSGKENLLEPEKWDNMESIGEFSYHTLGDCERMNIEHRKAELIAMVERAFIKDESRKRKSRKQGALELINLATASALGINLGWLDWKINDKSWLEPDNEGANYKRIHKRITDLREYLASGE